MRWPAFRRVLESLGYRITRQKGSHKRLEADGRPPLRVSFHDGQELPGSLVRKILVNDVGLTEDEARRLV